MNVGDIVWCIEEASNCPMVQAHLEFCKSMARKLESGG